jgi:hypothetical protein
VLSPRRSEPSRCCCDSDSSVLRVLPPCSSGAIAALLLVYRFASSVLSLGCRWVVASRRGDVATTTLLPAPYCRCVCSAVPSLWCGGAIDMLTPYGGRTVDVLLLRWRFALAVRVSAPPWLPLFPHSVSVTTLETPLLFLPSLSLSPKLTERSTTLILGWYLSYSRNLQLFCSMNSTSSLCSCLVIEGLSVIRWTRCDLLSTLKFLT